MQSTLNSVKGKGNCIYTASLL